MRKAGGVGDVCVRERESGRLREMGQSSGQQSDPRLNIACALRRITRRIGLRVIKREAEKQVLPLKCHRFDRSCPCDLISEQDRFYPAILGSQC